jgi:serine-type D-Ala-D-Ala carboxypeptidase/endopeptidase
MMFKQMARTAALLLALLCGAVNAQPQDFSDPVKLAKIALGDEQGSVAVGVLQGGALQRAFMHRSGKGAAIATSADGSPVGASSNLAQEQLFEIGSITKVFTGLLLAQAVEKGDLSLDDSLGKLLAGTVNFHSSTTAAISLRQLITHSSCLPRVPPGFAASLNAGDPYASFTRREMWEALSTLQLESPSPCPAVYSNLGLAMVGELLSHHYNKPWADLVSERITVPLGMKETVQALGDKAPRFAQGYDNQAKAAGWEFKAMAGAGALRSTVSDMLIFSRAMMAGSAGPLGPASQRMREPLGRFQNSQIGYALFIRGPEHKRSYMHDGLTGGYRAQWIISPSTQEAVIALASNAHSPTARMQNLLMAGLYPPTAQASNSALDTIGDYTGIYRVDKNTAVTFVVQNAKLYRRITGAGYRVLQPAGADIFVDADVGVQYVFQRHNGALVSLEYSQGGGGFKALKTDEPMHTQAIINHDNAKEYAGRYLLERSLRRNIDFDVKEDEGQLLVRSSNWQRRPVFPKPGHSDRFFYDAPNVEIQFERNEQGKIIALTLHEGGTFRMPKVSD